MKKIIFYLFCLFPFHLMAAEEIAATDAYKKYFFYWGYNRSFYTPSNIKFKGEGHNFELKNVTAEDRPSLFSSGVYFGDISVPQYNWRFGYKFTPNWNVSIGHDHMKYVVNQGQTVVINGQIDASASAKYAKTYSSDSIRLEEDFLMFEHTDGLNYISGELEAQQPADFANLNYLSLIGGLGFGPVIPRSDVRLFGRGRNHMWNISGWGFSMHVGMQVDFLESWFVRFTGKFGRLEMKNIPTTGDGNDRAQQLIHFMENYVAVGYKF